MNHRPGPMSDRKTATFVGALFLVAMVSSIMGGEMIRAIISAPDALTTLPARTTEVIIGLLLELVNALAVVGIGVLMFSILARHSQRMALGYLGMRIIEAVFCSAIVISPLSVIALSRAFLQGGSVDLGAYQAAATVAMAGRSAMADLLIPVFLSLGAMVLYSAMYRSGFLPRFIAVWGWIGAALILAMNIILTFGIVMPIAVNMVLALPIITNEIFMGIWLIVKGFSSPDDAPARA